MYNIINAELFKLRKDKSMKVTFIVNICVGIFVALMFLLMVRVINEVPMDSVANALGSEEAAVELQQDMASENIFSINDNIVTAVLEYFDSSNIILILLGVLAGTYVAGEFDRGTVRNTISKVRKRSQFYLGKLLSQFVSMTALVVTSVIAYLLTLVIFVGIKGDVSGAGQYVNLAMYMLTVLLYFFAYSSLFVMVAFLVRNVGATIAIAICSILFESTITQLFVFTGSDIMIAIADLMPISLLQQVSTGMAQGTFSVNAFTFIIPVVIIIISTLIGIMTFEKRDVC